MAKIQTTKKRRLVKTADKSPTTPKLEPEPDQDQNDDVEQEHDLRHKHPQSGSGSDSDSDPADSLPQLLEPYSKDQLISLIATAASADASFLKRIRRAADADVSHRKIFVHGLGWDTTRETLVAAFAPFGEVEDSNLVMDKLTGKTKGYGFVLFKTRRAALKALKDPKKTIGNRTASCQLASVGPGTNSNLAPSSSSAGSQSDVSGRKIYVSGVPHEAEAEKLKALFARFGEIETGPMGFDSQTGKSRGFALFLYKTVEGAKKALEEPVKVFEGTQLSCQKAAEGSKNKNNAAAAPQQTQTPPLAAVPGAFFGQYNPLYGGLMANMGGALVPGAGNAAMMARPMNPGLLAGALNGGVFPAGQYGQVGGGGFGGVTHGMGSFGAGGSLLGAYGSIAPLPTMQGLPQVYPSSQGQTATVRPQGTSGYQPYMWYDILACIFHVMVLCIGFLILYLFTCLYSVVLRTFVGKKKKKMVFYFDYMNVNWVV